MGKVKEHFYRRGIEHYLIRLKPYAKINVIELQEGKTVGKDNFHETALHEEAEEIKKNLRGDAYSIVLDAGGKKMRSEELAIFLERLMIEGKSKIDFIIGGPDGLAKGLINNGDLCLSLSDLTFPHRMARLILLEQLYRCFKIIRGEPYHR